jgi:hypothetical protein
VRRTHQRRATDCFSACLASLLAVPLETVPHFYVRSSTVRDFYTKAQRWLAKHHGLTLVTVLRPDNVPLRDMLCRWPVPAKFIASVLVPEGWHSVVCGIYRSRLRVVHNPDPTGSADLRSCNDISFLVPLFKGKGKPQ